MKILDVIDEVLTAEPDLFEHLVSDLFPDNGYREGEHYVWDQFCTYSIPYGMDSSDECIESHEHGCSNIEAKLELPFQAFNYSFDSHIYLTALGDPKDRHGAQCARLGYVLGNLIEWAD